MLTDDQKAKVLRRFFEERERRDIRNLAATKPEIRALADAIAAGLDAVTRLPPEDAIKADAVPVAISTEVAKIQDGEAYCTKLAEATYGPHTKDEKGAPVLAPAVGDDLFAVLSSVVAEVVAEG